MLTDNIPFRSYKDDPITIAELKDMLSGYPDDTKIGFGSTVAAVPLIFNRVKQRGPDLVQIELAEDFPQPGTYTVIVDPSMGSYTINAPHLKQA